MKIIITSCLFVLSACATVSSHETINGQKVAVGQSVTGDTIKRFPYQNGTSLTVKYNQSQAIVSHVIQYPATDAQKVSYTEQASGCRSVRKINQFNQSAQGGVTRTIYSLSC